MKKILTLFFSLTLVLGLTYHVQAKDVELDRTTVDAEIHEDGTVTIQETWEVDFDGSFSQFERKIPINDDEWIDNFYVTVNGANWKQLEHTDSNRPEGYYALTQYSDEAVLDIYMDAWNETMTFTITYTMGGTVHRYQDVAEFNYNMIGSEWDFPIGFVSGTITFPKVQNIENDIHVWGHGSANGTVDIVSDQSVYYECDYLASNTALNIRLLLPSEMFSSLSISSNQAYLDAIIEEEAEYAKKEARHQTLLKILLIGSGAVGAIGSIAGIVFIALKRRKITHLAVPKENPQYYRDLPSGLSPSEVIDLLNYKRKKYDDQNKFSSTLMSLCLYGLLEFVPYEEDGFFKTKKRTKMIITRDAQKEAALKPHERKLYRFICEAGNEEVTFDDIERMTKRRPKYCQKQLDEFRTGSAALVEKAGFFNLRVNKGAMYVVSIILLILGGIMLVPLPFAGVPLFISGFICLFLTISSKAYSQKGIDEVALWLAFERFLKEFTLMDEKELPELVMWEEYLVYAVALGIGEKVLKQLPEVYPNFYESDFYRYSYIRGFYYHGAPDFRVFNDIQSLSSDMKTAMQYHENSGGHGGSFSGGGGGGFAGGGSSSGGGGGSFS